MIEEGITDIVQKYPGTLRSSFPPRSHRNFGASLCERRNCHWHELTPPSEVGGCSRRDGTDAAASTEPRSYRLIFPRA